MSVQAPEPEAPLLVLPANALVMLVGASGSGKSWWARQCFRETQVVSSDRCRALVSDEEADQTGNREAFAVFYEILRQRLSLGRLSVADSTALSGFVRERLRGIAGQYETPVHAVVIHAPLEALRRNNLARARRVPDDVLQMHARRLRLLAAERVLEQEGYAGIHHVPADALVWFRPQVVEPLPAATA